MEILGIGWLVVNPYKVKYSVTDRNIAIFGH